MELLKDEKIKPITNRKFPIDEIRNAHEYLESGAQFGKVVLSYE
jgi:NADPH:quinone reductase-like Zn-dependent oxidoreductase